MFLTNQRPLPAATICALYKSRRAPRASGTTAGRAVLQVDQAASAHQEVLWHIRKRGEDADLDRRFGLCAGRHRQEAAEPRRLLYTLLQIFSLTLFEKMPILQALSQDQPTFEESATDKQLNLLEN